MVISKKYLVYQRGVLKLSKKRKQPKAQTKKQTRSRKVTNVSGRDVTLEVISVVVGALAILLIVSFLDLAGKLGGWLKTGFYWSFGGLTSWLLILFIGYVALIPFGREAREKVRRGIYVLLFCCSLSIFLGVLSVQKGTLTFAEYVNVCADQAKFFHGGALGGAAAYGLKALLDEVGSFIVSLALLLITVILAKYRKSVRSW